MKQQQFYKYATWGLLLLNLALITSWMVFRPGPIHPGAPPKGRAIEVMELDETQHVKFEQIADMHSERIISIREQQRQLLDAYFQSLVKAMPDSVRETKLSELLQFERTKIELTYQHFEEVKALLRPEQYAGFEQFVEQSMRIIQQKGEGRGHHPKGREPHKDNH